MARMTAAISQIANKYAAFNDGDSVPVLENLIENPYGVTPNEDVARLSLTFSHAIVIAYALAIKSLRATPNTFGVYPPVVKGGEQL